MFLVAAQITKREETRETLTDLQSKSVGAARWAMRGERWSDADREECAAHLVAKILDTLPTVAKRGTAAEVLRYVTTVQSAPPEDAPMIRRLMVPGADWTPDTVPSSHATFTRLAMEASNYRRALEASRRHDQAEAERREASAPVDMDSPHVAADSLDGLWERDPNAAAHETARRMLADLGLARLGKAYPVALEMALTAHGWTVAEVAKAMGVTPEYLRKIRSRAIDRIPSAKACSVAAHCEALSYPDTAVEHAHVASLAIDWREAPTEEAPTTVRRTGSAREVLAWIDATPTDRPEWTRGIHPATARRYEAAHAYRVARGLQRSSSTGEATTDATPDQPSTDERAPANGAAGEATNAVGTTA